MKDAVIPNPVLNPPSSVPARYFRFDDEGITNEIIDGRRPSSYFMPVAAPKKWGKNKGQAVLDTEWTNQLLIDFSFFNPYVTVAQVAAELNITRQTAANAIKRLQKDEILTDVTGAKWNRLYFCTPVQKIIDP